MITFSPDRKAFLSGVGVGLVVFIIVGTVFHFWDIQRRYGNIEKRIAGMEKKVSATESKIESVNRNERDNRPLDSLQLLKTDAFREAFGQRLQIPNTMISDSLVYDMFAEELEEYFLARRGKRTSRGLELSLDEFQLKRFLIPQKILDHFGTFDIDLGVRRFYPVTDKNSISFAFPSLRKRGPDTPYPPPANKNFLLKLRMLGYGDRLEKTPPEKAVCDETKYNIDIQKVAIIYGLRTLLGDTGQDPCRFLTVSSPIDYEGRSPSRLRAYTLNLVELLNAYPTTTKKYLSHAPPAILVKEDELSTTTQLNYLYLEITAGIAYPKQYEDDYPVESIQNKDIALVASLQQDIISDLSLFFVCYDYGCAY